MHGAAALTSYFPALQLRDLAGYPEGPVAPRVETGAAAVLFADLVGFSALADALSADGPRGAEELSRIIDTHFGRLTDLVLAAGGDVLAYAGDAALVAWPAPGDGPPVEALARAATSGLRLLKAMSPPAGVLTHLGAAHDLGRLGAIAA
jgi:class 3 adenylate cyclase